MEQRYTTSNRYMLREIAGEAVLISVKGGIADFCGIVRLNASAATIWKELQKGCTKESLVATLLRLFVVSRSQAETDVEETIEFLLKNNMIVNA